MDYKYLSLNQTQIRHTISLRFLFPRTFHLEGRKVQGTAGTVSGDICEFCGCKGERLRKCGAKDKTYFGGFIFAVRIFEKKFFRK